MNQLKIEFYDMKERIISYNCIFFQSHDQIRFSAGSTHKPVLNDSASCLFRLFELYSKNEDDNFSRQVNCVMHSIKPIWSIAMNRQKIQFCEKMTIFWHDLIFLMFSNIAVTMKVTMQLQLQVQCFLNH